MNAPAPKEVTKVMPSTLAKSFVKAQKAFAPALKTSSNPHFKSRYADLAMCVEAVIDALNENGIALIQKTHPCDDGVLVETIFLHESGEELSGGLLHVPADRASAQGYGSALTYARRYSLMASCGIAQEDDDGNAASKPKDPPKQFDIDKAVALLNTGAKTGSKGFLEAAKGIPDSVKSAIDPKVKSDIWAAAKMIDDEQKEAAK
jgi:hypothetical protein